MSRATARSLGCSIVRVFAGIWQILEFSSSSSQERFLCCGSQRGQNAQNWQPRIIPRIPLPFRDSRTVSSKRRLSNASSERHQRLDFWLVSGVSELTRLDRVAAERNLQNPIAPPAVNSTVGLFGERSGDWRCGRLSSSAGCLRGTVVVAGKCGPRESPPVTIGASRQGSLSKHDSSHPN